MFWGLTGKTSGGRGGCVKNKMRPRRLETRKRGNGDTMVRMRSRLITGK